MYHHKPLIDHLHDLESFYTDMQLAWTDRGGDPVIRNIMKDSEAKVRSGAIKGLMLFKDDTPVAWATVERLTHNYGSAMMHALDDAHKKPLIETLRDSGLLDDSLVELFTFHVVDEYAALCKEAGLTENYRQRMAYNLEETPVAYPEWPTGVSVVPTTPDMHAELCDIYAKAHQVSKDYQGFYELEQPDRRLKLEKAAIEGVYGRYIPEASLTLYKDGHMMGGVTLVEIETWGMPQVPWVFDIALHPNHHGHGYGKRLMQHSMAVLSEMNYHVMGLAVTMNNATAKALYERLGYFVVDPFYEFAYKVR